jgi:hypothetical protein
MTVVNISGTFSKDQRPNNGLDAIADKLKADEFLRVAVVGIVEFHGYHRVAGRPEAITVRFAALEPQFGDADDQARQMLDQARKARGLGQVELTLFDGASHGASHGEPEERDPTAGPWPGDAEFVAPPEDDGPTSERTHDVWLDDPKPDDTPPPKPSRRRKPPSTPDGE